LRETVIDLQAAGLDDPTCPDDVFPEEDYDTIKSKSQDALAADGGNPMAHLGMAVLEAVSINYAQDLWDLYADLVYEPLSGRILNNELTFLVHAPRDLSQVRPRSAGRAVETRL
jgi:hypothetical protein